MTTFDFDVIGDPLPPKRIVPAQPSTIQPAARDVRQTHEAPKPAPADRREGLERLGP
jgi:hypothetical protein